MNNIISGLYWHLHHDILVEWCYDERERIDFINEYKPEGERPLRLELFKRVKGELPKEFIQAGQKIDEAGQKIDEAGQKIAEAGQKFDEAGQKFDEAGQKIAEARQKYAEAGQKYAEAWQKYDEAGQKFDEARQKYDEARQKFAEARQKYKEEINILHSQECPNCPWDGGTIFPVAAF